MRLRDAAALAISGLRGSAVRTLLTVLGLGVGVGAVLTVQALGAAGEVEVEKEISRLGVDRVWITPTDAEHTLSAESALLIEALSGAPACAGAATADAVILGEKSVAAQVAGYDASMQDAHAVEVSEGRLFTDEEYRMARAVCVVDGTLANDLGGDVVGCEVYAAGIHLRVVGVMSSIPAQAMKSGGSGLLAMPLTTYCEALGGTAQEVTIAIPTGRTASEIADLALEALGEEGYRADSLENEIDAAKQIVRIFVMVLSCVAAVCMLTGAIGVMNVLLVSVRERRREIGLIKALGGTSAQVGLIFLLEATAYALAGGLLGLATGAMLVWGFGAWVGLDAALVIADVLPVLASAAALGAAFGVFPAIRAAGMQVVDALRSD